MSPLSARKGCCSHSLWRDTDFVDENGAEAKLSQVRDEFYVPRLTTCELDFAAAYVEVMILHPPRLDTTACFVCVLMCPTAGTGDKICDEFRRCLHTR